MSTNVMQVKTEQSSAPVVTCCFCLASERDTKLSFTDLSNFYNFFKPCGIGTNISGHTHYNYACSFCSRRASQCLRFLNTARTAERVFNLFFQNEVEIAGISPGSSFNIRMEPPVRLSTCFILDGARGITRNGDETSMTDSQASPNDTLPIIERVTTGNVECQQDGSDNKQTKTIEQPLRPTPDDEDSDNDEREFDAGKTTEQSNVEKNSRDLDRIDMKVIQLSLKEQFAELETKRQSKLFLGRPFKCFKCAISYYEKQCLDTHNDLHSQERGNFECAVCTRRFSDAHNLQTHEHRHRTRWQCLRCDIYLTNKEQVRVHRSACTSGEPVQCTICKNLFKDHIKLKKHMTRHMDNRRFTCDVCGKTFGHKQLIKYHLRVHTKEKPHECDICGKKFATLSSRRLHAAIHTRRSGNNSDLYCVECDKYFKNKYILSLHYKNTLKHNSPDNFRHKCPDCPERFSLPCYLRRHVARVHTRAHTRPHRCTLCEKAYYTRSGLSVHVRSKHSNSEQVRDKVCPVCKKAFTANSTLKNHLVIHSLERPFSCLICAATFRFKASLYTHTKLKHKTIHPSVKRNPDDETEERRE